MSEDTGQRTRLQVDRLDPAMREVLSLARWAPSGDNTQPWRFEVLSDRELRVHGFDTREHCVYDLDGRPSRLSIGALLETLSIAATSVGLSASISRVPDTPETRPVFKVQLLTAPDLLTDPLVAMIEQRTVQRRPLSTRPIALEAKRALEASVGAEHEVIWFEGIAKRWALAALMFRSARIRLTIEEAYRVHASVIEWRATVSDDKIPDAAIGLDPLSLAVMRWVMGSWTRTRFVSRYLGGTLAPRLQLDLLPAMMCGAHAVIVAREAAHSADSELDKDISAGRAIQRFWLTAEHLGLRHQPEMTPLIFSRYAAEGRRFATDQPALRIAQEVLSRLDALLGPDVRSRAVWLGRVGAGKRALARSVRRPLESLLINRASSDNPW